MRRDWIVPPFFIWQRACVIGRNGFISMIVALLVVAQNFIAKDAEKLFGVLRNVVWIGRFVLGLEFKFWIHCFKFCWSRLVIVGFFTDCGVTFANVVWPFGIRLHPVKSPFSIFAFWSTFLKFKQFSWWFDPLFLMILVVRPTWLPLRLWLIKVLFSKICLKLNC